jgi:hypothetical protein
VACNIFNMEAAPGLAALLPRCDAGDALDPAPLMPLRDREMVVATARRHSR